jgi:diacylglycerol kinase family enzyme
LHARVFAVTSLVAGILAVILVIVFLVRNGVYIVLGLVGVLVAIVGGWWAVLESGARRLLGYGAAALGTAAMVAAVLVAGSETWASVIRLLAALALSAIAIASARAALVAELRRSSAGTMAPVEPPRHPVLLCNPWSGGGKVETFGLQELASSLGVETVMLERGLDLERLARQAIERGADCLGMAGGDGSQALVASIAVEHDLPFVCVTAGTRNHFALDLGIDRDDPRNSVHAFRDAIERRIDYATVNDRFFVNNVSLGIYATIVQQEGYREAKSDTTRGLLPEMLGAHAEPFDLQFTLPDGREIDGAFLIQVSNNPYVLGPSLDVSQRRRLDSGRLGVFAVSASTGSQAAQALTLALAGKPSASGSAFQFECQRFEVRSRSGEAYVGIDGEALKFDTPLRFEIHPKGLRLLVPEGNPGAALRRAARDVHVRDLVNVAAGRSGFTGT